MSLDTGLSKISLHTEFPPDSLWFQLSRPEGRKVLHIGQQNSGRLLASQNPPSVKQAVSVGGNQDAVPVCCPEDRAPDQVTVLFGLHHNWI